MLSPITIHLPDNTSAGALYHSEGYLLEFVFQDRTDAFEFAEWCEERNVDLETAPPANVRALFGMWKGLSAEGRRVA